MCCLYHFIGYLIFFPFKLFLISLNFYNILTLKPKQLIKFCITGGHF